MFSKELVTKLSSQLETILGSLTFFTPEIILASAFLLLLLLDLIVKKTKYWLYWSVSLASIFLTCVVVCLQWMHLQGMQDTPVLFLGMLQVDVLSVFFKFIFLLAGTLTLFLSAVFFRDKNTPHGEYFALVLAIILGLNLMVMSINLLMIYLAIELVSIISYILTIFHFHKKGVEGSLKYLLFGAFASGIMLYGMSWLYGFFGTLQLNHEIFANGLQEIPDIPVFIALFLAIGGLLFKISAFPFHIWTPDVYEAAPTPIIAFFSTAPKAAGILVLLRFSLLMEEHTFVMGNVELTWASWIAVLAMLTMTAGNFSALWQTNVRRLLAYSSIAQAGFLMIVLVAVNESGIKALLFYIVIYICMNFLAFFLMEVVASYRSESSREYDLSLYAGLGMRFPWIGVLFLFAMVSLTGLPPTAGFTAKLLIFTSLWEATTTHTDTHSYILFLLFLFGLFNTAVALFYYLKIPYYLFFKKTDTSSPAPLQISVLSIGILTPLAASLLVFFIKADWLMEWINQLLY